MKEIVQLTREEYESLAEKAGYNEKEILRQARKLYEDYYATAAFTHVMPRAVDLKQVVNTNKCLLQLEKNGDKLLIVSCIDNLLKGASGQAVQNMNLIFGLPEKTGLMLKPSAF